MAFFVLLLPVLLLVLFACGIRNIWIMNWRPCVCPALHGELAFFYGVVRQLEPRRVKNGVARRPERGREWLLLQQAPAQRKPRVQCRDFDAKR